VSNWPKVALGEVVEINPRHKWSRSDLELDVTFVPMAAVDETKGIIADPEVRPLAAATKGFTNFREDDVLFAKITPCMENGKAAIARRLRNRIGGGSTEFYVLRSSASILPDFVYYFVRQKSFRAGCKANFTGSAGQQRVPKSYLERVEIPLPPLEEQRRIVALLDRAAEIRWRAEAARDKARAIIPALFVGMFGDPATLAQRFPVAEMGEIISNKQLGIVRSTRDQPENGTYGYVRMNAITTDGRVVLEDLRRTNASAKEAATSELHDGDLLFNTRNSRELVGKMGIYRGPSGNLFNNNIMRIKLEECALPEFVNAYFQCSEGRSAIESVKKGTTSVCAVYFKDLAKIRVPIPPLQRQLEFVRIVLSCERLHANIGAQEKKAGSLAIALSAEVFA
jgi:type I restriction enzyme S subunit